MWSRTKRVQEFLKKEFGIEALPKRTQFYKILTCVNYKEFSAAFERWIMSCFANGLMGETIAIDGKSIRSTAKLRESGQALHIASAMIASSGVIITSKECTQNNSSETAAFREILQELNVTGSLVVADALHCNVQSAQSVIDAEADYLFNVKNNQRYCQVKFAILKFPKFSIAYTILFSFSSEFQKSNVDCVVKV